MNQHTSIKHALKGGPRRPNMARYRLASCAVESDRDRRERNGEHWRARHAARLSILEAARLEQIELEGMYQKPRSRIAEITGSTKVAPPADVFAAFDAAVARDAREQNSLRNILEARMVGLDRMVRDRAPLQAHVDFEGRMVLSAPGLRREDYKDTPVGFPVRWINGLPIPQSNAPKAQKSNGIRDGDGSGVSNRAPLPPNDTMRTDIAVNARIREIVAFDDVFERERAGVEAISETSRAALARIARISKTRAWEPAWQASKATGLSGKGLNQYLKATRSVDYNEYLNEKRQVLGSCERRLR